MIQIRKRAESYFTVFINTPMKNQAKEGQTRPKRSVREVKAHERPESDFPIFRRTG